MGDFLEKSMLARLKDSSGMALLLTVFAVSFLTVVTLRLVTSVRMEIRSAADMAETVRLDSLLYSGLNYALAVVQRRDWTVSGSLEYTPSFFSGDTCHLVIADVLGKIQVNALLDKNGNVKQVQKNIWRRFLEPFDIDSIRAATIVGAIRTKIRQEGGIGDIGSLADIEGLNGIMERIAPYLTIYRDPDNRDIINIIEAEPPVLRVLGDGITEEAIREIDAFRRDRNNADALADTNWCLAILAGYGVAVDQGLTMTTTPDKIVAVRITAPAPDQSGVVDGNGLIHEKIFTRRAKAVIEQKINGPSVLEWHLE